MISWEYDFIKLRLTREAKGHVLETLEKGKTNQLEESRG